MLEFRTQGYNPYAVKYSPYYDSRIAVATSANFGIVGNGRVFVLGLTPQGIQVEKTCVSHTLPYPVNVAKTSACRVASTPMMPCTISHGPRSTRTRPSSRAETAP